MKRWDLELTFNSSNNRTSSLMAQTSSLDARQQNRVSTPSEQDYE